MLIRLAWLAQRASNHAEQPDYDNHHDDASPEIGSTYWPPQALIAGVGVGLAERGQRRVEGPLLGWIRFELDSYIDPDSLTLHCALGKKPPQGSSI
jgi:hypothetical protein